MPIDSSDKIQIRPSTFILHKTNLIQQDYELGPILGSGAYGSVRTAVHKASGQERAIKTVKKEKLSKSMQSQGRFFAEIEILRQIDHPNILRLFEFYEDKKSYHLVTEILKGGELFEFIVASGQVTEKIAAHFMRQILFAVNYCHKRGIVHRDLKPENLLLERRAPNATLKVIDFGASALHEDESVPLKVRFGTSYYIAPEVLKRNYSEKCDIWSCGVILYILLAGRPPFGGRNDQEILERVRKGKYSLEGPEWNAVSDTAKTMVRKMMTVNPSLRYSAEEALKDNWLTESLASSVERPLTSIVEKIKEFRATEKLQHAVLAFITSQLVSKEETKQMADTFLAIDTNRDGKLSREELRNEFLKTMCQEEAEFEVEKIFSQVDMDQNGFIDYSEFLVATLQKDNLMSKRNLEAAFNAFDRDGSGAISASEIKSILAANTNSTDNVWNKIIENVDQNGDGQIDLKEFKDMMLKILEG
jgi:calcium-dependent protein kinase